MYVRNLHVIEIVIIENNSKFGTTNKNESASEV